MIRPFLVLVVGACALACGCNTYTSSYVAPGTPSSIGAGTGSATLGAAVVTAALPPTVGYTGTIDFPAVTPGAALALYDGVAPENGTTTPVLAPSQVGTAPAPIPLIYIQLTPNANVSLPAYPGFTITLPANIPTGPSFFLGFFNPAAPLNGYALATEGPASVSNGVLTFAPPPVAPPQLQANQTYGFVLYEIPTPSPSSAP